MTDGELHPLGTHGRQSPAWSGTPPAATRSALTASFTLVVVSSKYLLTLLLRSLFVFDPRFSPAPPRRPCATPSPSRGSYSIQYTRSAHGSAPHPDNDIFTSGPIARIRNSCSSLVAAHATLVTAHSLYSLSAHCTDTRLWCRVCGRERAERVRRTHRAHRTAHVYSQITAVRRRKHRDTTDGVRSLCVYVRCSEKIRDTCITLSERIRTGLEVA